MLEHITLSGEPFERGVAHGEAFVDEIEANIEHYFEYFMEKGLEQAEVRETAEDVFPVISELNANYAREVEGVAQGSGLPFEDVAMINIRHTISYMAFADELADDEQPTPSAEGCTSFGLRPEVTADGHTYVGQNWDWLSPLELLVMTVEQPDKPTFVALTEAGMVSGKFGVNEHGIGFTANGLTTPEDGKDPLRKPSHVRGREIFDAERFDQAIGPVISGKRATARNYLLGHADGELVDIETTPDSFNYLYPEDGVLTHANHFENRDGIVSQLEQLIPDSICRGNRLRRLLLEHSDDISVADMQTVLRDHFSHPKSICRHNTDDDPLETKSSLVIDLTDRTMLATDGPPCSNEYQEFSVN